MTDLRLSKSIVTCFCSASYNSSFSCLSNRASFSRLDLELLGGRPRPSFFVFGVDSADSNNLVELFLLLDSGVLLVVPGSLFSRLTFFGFAYPSSNNESLSELPSSYFSVIVRLRPLVRRRILSSLIAEDTVGRRAAGLEGKRGSKMSPLEGAEEGRPLAGP